MDQDQTPQSKPNEAPALGVIQELTEAAQRAEPMLSGRAPGTSFQVGGPNLAQQQAADAEARVQQNLAGELESAQMAAATAKPIKLGRGASSLVLLVLGVALAAIGWLAVHANGIPAGYTKTTATVTEPHYNFDSASNQMLAQIRFQYIGGTTTATIPNGQSGNKYLLGNEIKIAYNPALPSSNVKNLSDQTVPFYGVVMIAVGGLLALLGLINPLLGRRQA